MNTLIVIQARMGSTRLPGKVLEKVWRDLSLLEFLIARMRRSNNADEIVVATTALPEDNPVAETALGAGVEIVRGSENDLLARFRDAVGMFPGTQWVVRVTADNPLTCPELLDRMLDRPAREGFDYVHAPDAPIGTGADVFSKKAFDVSCREASTPYRREHINAFILDHSNRFRICRMEIADRLKGAELCVSIDTEADLECVRDLLNIFPDPEAASLDEIVNELKKTQVSALT